MLDLFTIFSKGGIVLWCFQSTSQLFTPSVNALIRTVILQERSGSNLFTHENLILQYKLDNEFELVFVVAYQKILQLSYIDKFLNDIHLQFRDKYKDDLQQGRIFQAFDFGNCFSQTLRSAEEGSRREAAAPKKMRTFEESSKSKKTVASMIENRKEVKAEKPKEKKNAPKSKAPVITNTIKEEIKLQLTNGTSNEEVLDEQKLQENRMKFMEKMKPVAKKPEKVKSPQAAKKGKQGRIWDNAGTNKDAEVLDFSKQVEKTANLVKEDVITADSVALVGKMRGEIQDMDEDVDEGISDDDTETKEPVQNSQTKTKGRNMGVFGMFKTLVGSKEITPEDMQPVLDKLKDHMIAKNVAAEISEKLCNSVAAKLNGKVLGTFTGVASTVKSTLTESLVQILSPRRRINILRDVMECQRQTKPYVMTFCGVNGVGKSTNLAKIAFWLIENNFQVLIAACDTFRAGAVEQLRTHTRHLNALHPANAHGGNQMVQLYEKGYGKDAAGIAMEAIRYARDSKINVVLVDTAGRMQDNEPLMRALAKLIKVNEPDLVLFVGEALVGNEAVDQLVKFNQALADHSNQENPHLIDGIVLTKFDTIDDKVGAAVSMTYITGQPIVFVGTGQTYTDLKNLNAKAVVSALMK
uniref:Signal recognition particle receptor subunit alpha n=1 Tax=Scolopendra viridis TaxID=118503 RepID=A0A4D5R9G9_SCOVI